MKRPAASKKARPRRAGFKEQVPLRLHSHYRIGGPGRFFAEPRTVPELKAALRAAKREKLPVLVLGGGTNLLIADEGFRGFVIRPRFGSISARGREITAGAGASMADLLEFSARKKLSGMEWAGGLPGTVGGAVRGNAGCFGKEMKDVVKSVTSLDVNTLKTVTRSARACRFGYRTSVFKQRPGREIVVSVTVALRPGDPQDIRRGAREKIEYRTARHPLEYPNIGSIFKNVPLADVPRRHLKKVENVIKNDPFPVVPAAFLIAQVRLAGVARGGAMISPKHPNFIVNVLNARAADVHALIELVKKEVKNEFGIDLEEEVIRI